jgi:eukaryotic-like serine/threonine-protein kinase
VVAAGELKAVDIATGGVRTIGKVRTEGLEGGAWNRDDIILLGGPRLQRMSVADGQLTDVYGPSAEITSQFFPAFLPGGRTFLYAQESSNAQQRGVFLGSLDAATVTRLLPEPANAVFSSRGYLVYGRQGTLFAHGFDMEHKRLFGKPFSIGSGIDVSGSFTSFTIAGDVLLWSGSSLFPPAKLMWIDRNGKTLDTTVEARPYNAIALAPDQRRVVSAEADPRVGIGLFVMDLPRSIPSRLTTAGEGGLTPSGRQTAVKWHLTLTVVYSRGESIRRAELRCSRTVQ